MLLLDALTNIPILGQHDNVPGFLERRSGSFTKGYPSNPLRGRASPACVLPPGGMPITEVAIQRGYFTPVQIVECRPPSTFSVSMVSTYFASGFSYGSAVYFVWPLCSLQSVYTHERYATKPLPEFGVQLYDVFLSTTFPVSPPGTSDSHAG